MSIIIAPHAPQDALLPQLATLLDGEAMAERFAALLPKVQVQECLVERVKYRAGKNAVICYRLEVVELNSQRLAVQRYCARVYPLGSSASRFRRAQRQALVQAKVGPALSHLPELGVVLWAFPNDRKLQGLPQLMDDDFLRKTLLPPLVATHWGKAWQITELTNEMVHYAPEYTCMVRTQLKLVHAKSAEEKSITLFGKLYEDDQGAQTEKLMHLLWASQERASGQLLIAQPLGYQHEFKILWQIGLQGATLQSYDSGSELFRQHLLQAAESVALLHQSRIVCSKAVQLLDWIRKLQEMRQLLPQVWPSCQPAAHALIDRLIEQADALEVQPSALLHGDLHLQNIFVSGDQVALIDLDALQQGSPWQDIGSLAAALTYRALLAGTSQEQVEAIVEEFCRRYGQRAPWPASPRALRWYTAAALVNERAFRHISRLQNGNIELIDSLLERAQQILA